MPSVSEVRPILNPILTPKNYVDIVEISNKDENITRVTATSSGAFLYFQQNNIPCNTFLDRKVILEFECDITFRGVNDRPFLVYPTVGGPPNLPPDTLNKVALRYSPVLMNASNIEISINNQKTSYPINRFLEPLSRFNGGDGKDSTRLSSAPVFHDFGRYVDGVAYVDGVLGTPFDPITPASSTEWNTRGSIEPVSIVNGAGGDDSVVKWRWQEILFLSPLTDYDRQGGFYDITNISINIAMNQDPSKFLSINESFLQNLEGGTTILVPGVGPDPAGPIFPAGNQRMRLYTITPPFDDVRSSGILPANTFTILTTPYNIPVANMPTNNFLGASSFNITTNSISLNKVPAKILVFANRSGEQFGAADANTYGLINTMKVTYGNKSSYFDGYTQYDLWKQLMWDKGFRCPFSFYQETGSVFMIEPQDLYESKVAGSPCCNNLQIQLNITNIYPAVLGPNPLPNPIVVPNTTFQIMVILIYDAVCTYSRNTFAINELLLDDDEVYAKAHKEYNEIVMNSMTDLCKRGGGFKEEVLGAIGKVIGGVKNAKRFYSENASWIDPIIATAKDLGMTAIEVATSLFAAGLAEDEVYARLGRVYPAVELNKIRKSMKQAGCCNDRGDQFIGGSSKKKRKGGAMITDEADFGPLTPMIEKPKMSLRDRY